MPGELTKVDVERVAALARLALTDEEKDLYRQQLTEILAYARQVAALDTGHVAPTTQVLVRRSAERADVPRPTLAQADAVAGAPEPDRSTGLFKVPRVIAK